MTPPPAHMTTSWDDGHPLDARVAELLARYNLTGTFYVPKLGQHPTMALPQIRVLSDAGYEIGAHTMNHVYLDTVSELVAEREIVEGRTWVQDVTGRPCPMFCPPAGRFDQRHLRLIRAAGYAGIRTVELLSIDRPRDDDGLYVLPTTIHAYPHPRAAYLKNAAKRLAARNVWNYVLHGRSGNWVRMAQSLLDRVGQVGGVFHVWGHSWELEETGQWQRLEVLFRAMGERVKTMPCVTNGALCNAPGVSSGPPRLALAS